uniref:Uncharacterized protein n=1 Tax=Sphaerodactylus townsendi TaxID=933632 RepID=A0ACB8F9T9_9SAUR
MMRGPLLDTVRNKTVATKLFSLSGLFAVHKPKGPTSADVLNHLQAKLLEEAGLPKPRRKTKNHILKIGHGGILDSAATGVLVVKQLQDKAWETSAFACQAPSQFGWLDIARRMVDLNETEKPKYAVPCKEHY